jgi:hypothetical protein
MPADNKDYMQKPDVRAQEKAATLSELLDPSRVIALQATNKGQAIEELVNCVVKAVLVEAGQDLMHFKDRTINQPYS